MVIGRWSMFLCLLVFGLLVSGLVGLFIRWSFGVLVFCLWSVGLWSCLFLALGLPLPLVLLSLAVELGAFGFRLLVLGRLGFWSFWLLGVRCWCSVSWSFGDLVLWPFGFLVFWFFGLLVLWSFGLLIVVSLSVGLLVFWSSGLLVFWSSGPLVETR